MTLVTDDYFVKNPINDSIKLYAKFDKVSYGVMFYVNDTLDKTVQVLYQESITYQLDNPLFLGWSLTKSTNEVINKDYVVTKEVSLYAVFKKDNPNNDAPVITGTVDVVYVTGDEKINYLSLVTVTDDDSATLIFDDSSVDYNKAGTYEAYYLATDSFGLETYAYITISVISSDVAETFTEDFSLLDSTSSSYAGGEFIGNNDIKYVYQGMRTDQALDFKAMTFGKESTNQLGFILPSGLSSFSFDAAHAFSGSSVRNLTLYVNDELVMTFGVTAGVNNYAVNDLTYSGESEIRLVNSGGERVTIDNLTIGNLSRSEDYRDLVLDFKLLNLNLSHFTAGNSGFISSGSRGSTISYEFVNNTDVNNQFVDLVSGDVSLPSTGIVNVFVKVILVKGDERLEEVIEIKIGDIPPISILEAINSSNLVKVSGIVTGHESFGTYDVYYIEDDSAATKLHYSKEAVVSFDFGDHITFSGVFDKGNGYIALEALISSEASLVVPSEQPDDFSNDDLNKYYYISGYLKHDIKTLSFNLIDDTLNDDIRVVLKDGLSLQGKMGQQIEVFGHLVKDMTGFYIYVININSVELALFDVFLFESMIKAEMNLSNGATISNDISLMTKSQLFDISVIWQTSNASVITNTGKVYSVEVDTPVKLSFEVYQGVTKLFSGSFDIVVTSGTSYDGYYSEISGLSGTNLLDKLETVISRNYYGIGYTSTSAVLEKADANPNGSGYIGIYDHTVINSYNKEHVWPQSSFSKASPYRSDMHHLRLSIVKTNSMRSNYYFNNPTESKTTWHVGDERFFPGIQDKGDIARMVMYMAVRYRSDGFNLVITDSGRTSNLPARTLGNLAVFYDWHLEDPVDDFEVNRNNVIYGTQKNRNPFIDHPEIFEEIWTLFMNEAQSKRMSNGASNEIDVTLLNQSAFSNQVLA